MNLDEEAKRVWETVERLRKEGKLPDWTKEDLENEPSALANSKYREEAESRAYVEKMVIYSEVEEMIIRWSIDGTRTAGSLTREILKRLKIL
jgi:hypothetical protein